jgi:UDP-glucose 4-epimerase
MKTVVTGGAGCIGSDLAESLLSQGCEVTVVDNLSSGRIEHIQKLLSHPRFRFVDGDLLESGMLNRVVAGAQMVYHLAANPDVKFTPGDGTDKDLRQNVLATYNVLEAMRLHGVRRLAFSSTSAIYGISEVQPIPEHLSPRPISLYGATKLGCEALISAFSNLFEMQCWIFRFANIVGAKVRKKGQTVVSDFVHRLRENPRQLTILGDGRQAKSYMLASDCIEAMLYVIGHARERVNVYNLGCSDSLPVTRIAEMVVQAMGLPEVEYSFTGGEGGWPGDVPRFMLDVSALNGLGWKAHYTSEQAVAMAIDEVLHQVTATQTSLGGSACRP